jgi:hypothetical protein
VPSSDGCRLRRWLGWSAAALVIWPMSAWTMMIAAGIGHDTWRRLVPAMGYGTAVVLTVVPILAGYLVLSAVETIGKAPP